jgi:hypothetical protein
MRLRAISAAAMWAAIPVIVGCSSGSGNGSGSDSGSGSGSDSGASSVPTCKGATASTGPGSAACNSCLQGSCGSQVSSVQSSCSAYVTCYSGCQCSDTACITGCLSHIDSPCQNAYLGLVTCLSQSCSAPCNGTTDGG